MASGLVDAETANNEPRRNLDLLTPRANHAIVFRAARSATARPSRWSGASDAGARPLFRAII